MKKKYFLVALLLCLSLLSGCAVCRTDVAVQKDKKMQISCQLKLEKEFLKSAPDLINTWLEDRAQAGKDMGFTVEKSETEHHLIYKATAQKAKSDLSDLAYFLNADITRTGGWVTEKREGKSHYVYHGYLDFSSSDVAGAIQDPGLHQRVQQVIDMSICFSGPDGFFVKNAEKTADGSYKLKLQPFGDNPLEFGFRKPVSFGWLWLVGGIAVAGGTYLYIRKNPAFLKKFARKTIDKQDSL